MDGHEISPKDKQYFLYILYRLTECFRFLIQNTFFVSINKTCKSQSYIRIWYVI